MGSASPECPARLNSNPQLPPILGPNLNKQKLDTRTRNGTKAEIVAPIHVLTLTPFYPSQVDSASGCFVAEPLEIMSPRQVVSTVFAVQPFYRARIRARESAVAAQWLRYFSLPGGFGLPSAGAFVFARIVAKVRELQRSRKIDLIHAHGALPCGHAAMLLNAELNIPYVVSVHGLDAFSTEQVRGRASSWCRRISLRVYRSARRVICVSEHVREQVLEGTSRASRTSVVYNGVDPAMFSPALKNTADKLSLLSVGNLIPIKGHEVLIRAVASLAPEFPAVTLEIIGDGPEHSRLQSLAKQLQIAERVRFLGRKSRLEVAEAMRRCTVFALPSRYEGLGCVYLEAMSVGKPVVGCREQGIAEVVQHGSNGFLVGPNNEKELTFALAMLLRDESLRLRLGAAARDTILDRFTLSQQAQNFVRIYRESLGEAVR
jgi:teichuronic acid biosynthesis glycosyltransferase TuaC